MLLRAALPPFLVLALTLTLVLVLTLVLAPSGMINKKGMIIKKFGVGVVVEVVVVYLTEYAVVAAAMPVVTTVPVATL